MELLKIFLNLTILTEVAVFSNVLRPGWSADTVSFFGIHTLPNPFSKGRSIAPMQSATSSDFVPLATRGATAGGLSVQTVICSFTNLFLRQLVTQCSIAATSA